VPFRAASTKERPSTRCVLFFSDAPYEGGAERYIEYLVDAFPPGWRAEIVARDRRSLDHWIERLERRGIPVHRAADSTAGLLRTLWTTTRQLRPTIVHLNLPHAYSACYSVAAPVARLGGARRVVSTEHLTMIAPMRLRGRLRRVASRFLSRIITISRSNRSDLTKAHGLPGANIRVILNGVPDLPGVSEGERAAARASLGAESSTVLIVHVGALTARKGQRDLIEAMARLGELPWHLALVGEGEDHEALRVEIERRGLGGRIRLAGRREDIAAVLSAADLVVLPSTLEGMPLVLLEALAAGRPAIATTVYGVPEIYETAEAARLVPPRDPAALAEAIRNLITNPSLRERMGETARRLFLERFTSDRMARETLSVYEETLA
jgi:glycosyltransferase involved in cell wall biosynthesis